MKKFISISILASSLLFGAETYTQFLNTAIEDSYDIHNYSKAKIEQMLQNDAALQEYNKKLKTYETKVSSFLNTQTKESFESKEDAKHALKELEKLSSQNVALAKTAAYLASHQTDNANESYNNTIQITSKTILRLSDDIGVMADRILLMAKEIGIMADRIVQTQEIQSKNLMATQKLAQYAMHLTDKQVTTTKNNVNNMNTGMSNLNIHQMRSQQASQTTIQMH